MKHGILVYLVEKETHIKLLDCSTRDGGHLNKWHLDPQLAKKTYVAAKMAGVSIYEIGYRYPDAMIGLGPLGYCSDAFVDTLIAEDRSEECLISVMMDTGKSETHQFGYASDSPISMVRVAAYPYELEKAFWQVEELVNKGYQVFLNPMASSELTKDHFTSLRQWKGKELLQAIYFADSFGTYTPLDVMENMDKFHDAGFEHLGFHAHNNLQMAVANTLWAVDNGIEYVDATAFGIGRGAGNAPIEIVIGLLNRKGYNLNIFPYLELAHDYYEKLFKELNWAIKPQTVMGGLKNIHPYYMEDLIARGMPFKQMWDLLDRIKQECPISYSKTAVANLLE